MSQGQRPGRGGQLLAGFVVLHVLCCGLPLLIAAGAFTGAGALLGNGAVVAAGLLAVLAAVAVAVRRARRSGQDDCCSTTESDADVPTLTGQR
jgi:hypothetical protein